MCTLLDDLASMVRFVWCDSMMCAFDTWARTQKCNNVFDADAAATQKACFAGNVNDATCRLSNRSQNQLYDSYDYVCITNVVTKVTSSFPDSQAIGIVQLLSVLQMREMPRSPPPSTCRRVQPAHVGRRQLDPRQRQFAAAALGGHGSGKAGLKH